MAKTVNNAFDEFFENTVNVLSSKSDGAKKSRDWLFSQIQNICDNGAFLKSAPEYNITFGSYSRKTKIKPLDDIDIIIGLKGGDLEVNGNVWNDISLKVKSTCQDNLILNLSDKPSQWSDDKYLNSNKVKNKLVSALGNIPQYENADIHARGAAVTLKLKSYEWTYDIVPSFFAEGDQFNNPYYLIPNGKGKWQKTNPKLEQERVSRLNQKFNNTVLKTIRLVKYWNRRGQMPNITSYVLETIVLDYFDQASHNKVVDNKTSDWVDLHFRNVLNYIGSNIMSNVQDTKKIQGNINDLEWQQKYKIQQRAINDYNKARDAVTAETTESDMKKSINLWRDIFGSDFPQYV
ncbi:MAG: hypothetical protein PHW40_00875 [Candidatus Izemoplasmatales bacterium]|jgi:hypothetical protein|nr:hypothetical protein [Candidatus Izemoplasmatales bacterium]